MTERMYCAGMKSIWSFIYHLQDTPSLRGVRLYLNWAETVRLALIKYKKENGNSSFP